MGAKHAALRHGTNKCLIDTREIRTKRRQEGGTGKKNMNWCKAVKRKRSTKLGPLIKTRWGNRKTLNPHSLWGKNMKKHQR